ncbi:MAG: hypothetical protein ACYDHH_16585 [Solirubrobacteraceae bacterium]
MTHTDRTQRAGQLALGLIWLIDGALQYQPYMFHQSFITGVILPNAQGQPGIVASPITWIAQLIAPHVAVFNAFAATVQVLIGLGLLAGRRWLKPALLVSLGWAAAIWFTGEGLGGLLTGRADPLTGAPGAALLYIVAGLIVWPTGGRRLGLIGERGARLAWAALWAGSAVLWLMPANDGAGSIHGAVAGAPSGTSWLSSVLGSTASATAGAGTAIAVVLAVLSLTIALSVLTGTASRAFLVAGIALNLVYWVVGQGLGGVFTGSATDVNTAPLVILIGSLLLALQPQRTGHRSFATSALSASGTVRASSSPMPNRA